MCRVHHGQDKGFVRAQKCFRVNIRNHVLFCVCVYSHVTKLWVLGENASLDRV